MCIDVGLKLCPKKKKKIKPLFIFAFEDIVCSAAQKKEAKNTSEKKFSCSNTMLEYAVGKRETYMTEYNTLIFLF